MNNLIRRISLSLLVCMALLSGRGSVAQTANAPIEMDIDTRAQAHPFPHFWEQMFGSGRAILTLRESYRSDLRDVKKITDFKYVRFHNILHDEQGVYDETDDGKPIYNFSYIDQIYDGLLANGVRPCVEISFMPKKLAARQDVHPFWYKQIVAPPKDYKKWDDLIHAFAQHLVERYGIDEVAQWYFEVWNEPNIDFWSGDPKQATYFELYDHTARSLKAVSVRLRVGGPATAAAHWVDDFLKHAKDNSVPVDFVSTHGYADDTVEDLFGTHEDIPMDQRFCRAVKKVHDQIEASAYPRLPLFWTEWNVPSFDKLNARDTIYVGAALADDIRQCDGLAAMTSFWTFSDVFEEGGPKREPFDGGFGLIAMGGIHKPSYTAYALLHKLGDERLEQPAKETLVTRRKDGAVVIALWNLVDPDKRGGSQRFDIKLNGMAKDCKVRLIRLDETHGNSLAVYKAMGSPRYPSKDQVEQINRAAELPAPEPIQMHGDSFSIDVPVDGLYLVEASGR